MVLHPRPLTVLYEYWEDYTLDIKLYMYNICNIELMARILWCSSKYILCRCPISLHDVLDILSICTYTRVGIACLYLGSMNVKKPKATTLLPFRCSLWRWL